MTAAEVMTSALLDLTDHEQRPPCGDHTGRWVSEDRADRAQAARACNDCPLLGPCADLADELHVRFGTWGGRDRSPRPMKPRTTTREAQR